LGLEACCQFNVQWFIFFFACDKALATNISWNTDNRFILILDSYVSIKIFVISVLCSVLFHFLFAIILLIIEFHINVLLLQIEQTWCTIFLDIFIDFLYKFQKTKCPSSRENTVPMRHLVFVTLYRWLFGMQGGMKIKEIKLKNKNALLSKEINGELRWCICISHLLYTCRHWRFCDVHRAVIRVYKTIINYVK